MTRKENAIELAQRTANREGRPMAVLNLNVSGGGLYVVRDWDDGYVGERVLVAKVDPA